MVKSVTTIINGAWQNIISDSKQEARIWIYIGRVMLLMTRVASLMAEIKDDREPGWGSLEGKGKGMDMYEYD